MLGTEDLEGIKKGEVYTLPKFFIDQEKNLRVVGDMESDNDAHLEDNFIIGALLDGVVREYVLQFMRKQLENTYAITKTFITRATVNYHMGCKTTASFTPVVTVVGWNQVQEEGRWAFMRFVGFILGLIQEKLLGANKTPTYSKNMSMRFTVELKRGKYLIATYDIQGQASLEEVGISKGGGS